MLIWNISKEKKHIIHSAFTSETDEGAFCQAVEACAEKAISLLQTNIQDDSLYLLFEWSTHQASLSVTVTDSSKSHDGPETVKCIFSGLVNLNLNDEQNIIQVETIKFWLHDYLTTCSAFFSYSLVAIFHSSTRDKTELL